MTTEIAQREVAAVLSTAYIAGIAKGYLAASSLLVEVRTIDTTKLILYVPDRAQLVDVYKAVVGMSAVFPCKIDTEVVVGRPPDPLPPTRET